LLIVLLSCKPPADGRSATDFLEKVHNTDRAYDDQARFMAGLPGKIGSPYLARENLPAWRTHQDKMGLAWQKTMTNRLQKFADWSAAERKNHNIPDRVVLYPFSGPDTPSMLALYPNAPLYVMAGLERPGLFPNYLQWNDQALSLALMHIDRALSDLFVRSYFITSHMLKHLQEGQAEGTVPLMSLFLVMQGYEIINVFDLEYTPEGKFRQIPFGQLDRRAPVLFARIVFRRSPDRAGSSREQSILYFRANLADEKATLNPAIMQFLSRLPPANCFLKSAAYMLHSPNFNVVRTTLLDRCQALLQDDSGIALKFFAPEKWKLKIYGSYARPIASFSGWTYQADLASLYQSQSATPLPFNMGYHWQDGAQNLMLALRQ